ncbi:FlgD immunoglobulin-like domain containing protein [Vibrio astriarenae]
MSWLKTILVTLVFIVLAGCNSGDESPKDDTSPDVVVIDKFAVSEERIKQGDSVTLSWQTTGANLVTIAPEVGEFDPNETTSVEVSPIETTTYELVAQNGEMRQSKSVTVGVEAIAPEGDVIIEVFTASSSTIEQGDSVTLSWQTSGVDTITINPHVGQVDPSRTSSVDVTPTETTIYELVAQKGDVRKVKSLKVEVVPKTIDVLTIDVFNASEPIITAGHEVVLKWRTQHAAKVSISPDIGYVSTPNEGTVSIIPTDTMTYELTATDSAGQNVSKETTVVVKPRLLPLEIKNFTSHRQQIMEGESTTLYWELEGNGSIELVPSASELPEGNKGSIDVTPNKTTDYILKATGEDGSVQVKTLRVEVLPWPPEIVEFSVSKTLVNEGESVVLSWQTRYTDQLSLTPDNGDVTPTESGQLVVYPTSSTEYVMTASGRGGTVAATVKVEVNPTARIVLSPETGVAPLAVKFTPEFATNATISRIYWDFDGLGGSVSVDVDGEIHMFDRIRGASGSWRDYDISGLTHEYIFTEPGQYQPKMLAVFSSGKKLLTTASIDIDVAPPQVTVSVDTTTGEAPLTATFTVLNQGSDTLTYDWDFEGNGDIVETNSSIISHTYNTPGTYAASLTVTNLSGGVANVSLPHMEVRAGEIGDPSLTLTSSAISGMAPLSVTFSAYAQLDPNDTLSSWMFDPLGTGDWQTVTSTSTDLTLDYQYLASGTYYPAIKLATTEQKEAYAILEIEVVPEVSLVIESAELSPYGGSAQVHTTLSGNTELSIIIENSQKQTVRNLVDWQNRLVEQQVDGKFTDQWDGKNDLGEILPPGDYYAVLLYNTGRGVQRLDLRDTSGDKRFYPRDPRWTSRCQRTDSGVDCGTISVPTHTPKPMTQEPLNYQVSNPNFARLSAYHSIYRYDTVAYNFFNNLIVPPGNVDFTWNGEGNDNTILPQVGSKYLITVLGYTLADNVMVLNHLPKLSQFSLSSIVLDPLTQVAPNFGTMTASFDLSAPADLSVRVIDLDSGYEIYGQSYLSLDQGTQSVSWDGRLSNGAIAPPGNYFFTVTASSGGVEVPTEKRAFRVKY